MEQKNEWVVNPDYEDVYIFQNDSAALQNNVKETSLDNKLLKAKAKLEFVRSFIELDNRFFNSRKTHTRLSV